MKRIVKIALILLFLTNYFNSICFAWKTNHGDTTSLGTHESLSRYAVLSSSLKTCSISTDTNCSKLKEIGLDKFGIAKKITEFLNK